jgi:hypothetical protein
MIRPKGFQRGPQKTPESDVGSLTTARLTTRTFEISIIE